MIGLMRVGVAGWILGLGPSGVIRCLEALVEGARAAGVEVVFFAHPRTPLPPGILAAAAEVVPVPIPPQPTWWRIRSERKLLPRLVDRFGLDLLHLPHAPAHALEVPVTLTVHDLRDFTPFARPGRRFLAFPLWWMGLRQAASLLCVSRTTATELVTRYPSLAPRVRVIPTGVPARFFNPPGASRVGPGAGAILHTGRLLPHKNLSLLLQACRHLQDLLPNAPPLALVGALEDPRNQDLKAVTAALGLENQVHFAGALAEEAMPGLYANAALAVFPSLYEGQGLGPLEAMASGAPVLASRIPAHEEFAGPGALLFSPEDSLGLAREMARLLKDDAARAELAARGRDHARGCQAAAMGPELLRAWREVTAPGRGPAWRP